MNRVEEHAALPSRLLAYLRERFPLLGNCLLILSFYSSNQFLAHALCHPGEPMRYDYSTLCGCLTLLCFFLHIRIFDDHKDYLDDCRHFPDRVLQRNVVTLNELKWLAAAAIAVEFALAAIAGPAAVLSLLIAFCFSLLMLKEFFLGEWLKRRFLLYASVHMLIMPLLAMTIWSFATKRFLWQIPVWYLLYSGVNYFLAFNWEISRKIRVPEDEREGLDSYTRIFGTYGAAYLVLVVRMIDTVLVSLVAYHLGLSLWFYGLIVALFMVCLVGVIQYRFQTSTTTAHRLSIYAGVYIVAFDIALAIELVRTFGIQFSGTL
ncbi:UbiA family prenyltransferase [Roseimaritima ulvae]|uniref:Prenyltransferase n=1 Tax=Roseimaritima ulvae TaxID=980254 RepID=A0A5B9QHD8_9BACT|nr:UbiA family prenyltransferase [Roseimaritima ulvae]QEG38244.1 prenyltransferase [Roseimaritima ulvae]